jgi:hypothetical protein
MCFQFLSVLTLALLVFRVRADNHHAPVALDDFAFGAALLD